LFELSAQPFNNDATVTDDLAREGGVLVGGATDLHLGQLTMGLVASFLGQFQPTLKIKQKIMITVRFETKG